VRHPLTFPRESSRPWLQRHGLPDCVHLQRYWSLLLLLLFLEFGGLGETLRAAESRAHSGVQNSEGIIEFAAAAAEIEGAAASIERDVGGPGLTFLPGPAAWAVWSYKPTRWGMYDVELAGDTGANEASGWVVEIDGNRSIGPTEKTAIGAAVSRLGRIYLPTANPLRVRLGRVETSSASKQPARFQALRLRPAPEGGVPRPQADGSIVLAARDAQTHSVLMRYEPQPHKNCIGYWANAADWVEWTFEVTVPGDYGVELWQGCGKGQGGSDVQIRTAGANLGFSVLETGHFQIFAPRKLGRVHFETSGPQHLAVRALRKQAGAVMDIREIRLLPLGHGHPATVPLHLLAKAHRAVFLGDSITYAGDSIAFIETWLRLAHPECRVEILNLGLPSETLSGLSEPGHAGGSFPRPDLHERLARVLAATKPDLIVACYGMNDGIYYPPDEARFVKFKAGIERLRQAAAGSGALVWHLTPSVFDPVPLQGRTLPAGLAEYRQPFVGYNTVLDQFSAWLISKRADGFVVADTHQPMNDFLAAARARDPKFQLTGDGVHLNRQGHWLVAREVLRELGAEPALVEADTPEAMKSIWPRAGELLGLVKQRQDLLRDAWLTRIGHKRPGMNPGRPFDEALAEAAAVSGRIQALAGQN